MNWPQWIAIALFGLNVLHAANKDGQKRDGVYSFDNALLSVLIWSWLLYAGGFWG